MSEVPTESIFSERQFEYQQVARGLENVISLFGIEPSHSRSFTDEADCRTLCKGIRIIKDDMEAFQNFYPENLAHCYGCGRLNAAGHQIKTYWEGDESVTRFQPRPEHTAIPGFVYGGLLASLIDCHCTGTAAAAMYRAEKRPLDSLPAFRFVTGSLQVSYLKPTPLGPLLEIRGRVKEIKGRKVVVEATIFAEGVATARGEVVALQMPDSFAEQGKSP